MTYYVILMVISPLLNIIIANIDKVMYKRFLLIATIFWSVIPVLTNAQYGYSNDLEWYIVLYMYAGYIKRYAGMEKNSEGKHFLMVIALSATVVFSNIILIFLGEHLNIDFFTRNSAHLSMLNSPLILFIGLNLLIGVAKMKVYKSRKINILASATLGIYLIHDNNYVRPYLWGTICKNMQWYKSDLLIFHAAISIIFVYIICTLIDLLRQATIEKAFLKLADKLKMLN